ncbi:hypothetical protein [Janibacter cremeus]|uniref:Ferric siderophore reductase C-terminal domain-containing protein n=1 Tax=Janibacter cremeus TaxID=1285192 RepID=A0A852VQC6_9MICO|nr:hypothetical protein [Janibacter cremeus]NYF97968.1 hypothetical protein [Janibacter cremeus]
MDSSSLRAAHVADAFHLLRGAPTRAPLTLTPDLDPPTGLVGWHPVTRLTETPFVSDLVAAYSAGLSTRHLAVGGACGLQHYAGRFVLAAIGAWVQTSTLPDMDHCAWRVKLDESGHTLSVAPPVTGATHIGTAQDAASAIITAHLGPIVAAVREVSRITERVAHGCIAASCSSAFAALHRRTPPERQSELADLADRFMTAAAWRTDRPLVDLREVEVATGRSLVHERHVCCLIRLGRSRTACGTCPDIDPQERLRRITHQATAAARGSDLPLGVRHVP